MTAHPARTTTTTRIIYVAKNSGIWLEMMKDNLTIEEIEVFAKAAEAAAHEKSREYTAHFKTDEAVLTTHADCMRRLSGMIVLLRNGLVPALKIDRENDRMWTDAVSIMGWIRADLEAMEMRLT